MDVMGEWWERNGRAVAGVGLLGVVFVTAAVLAAVGSGGSPSPATAKKPASGSSSSTTKSPDGQDLAPGFRPTGVWFIDESEGWVIGGDCGDGRCARFMRTKDGARSWQPFDAPSIAGDGKTGDVTDVAGDGKPGDVTDVRFTDPRNGWAFGPGLWSTHDGGTSWTALDIGSRVLSLETTGPKAYALVASCPRERSDCQGPVRLYETAVRTDDWQPVFDIDIGSPSSPEGTLVVSGRSLYALVDPHESSPEPGKPRDLYALTQAGRWERRHLPASCQLTAALAAASPRDLFLSCQTSDGAGGSAQHEFHVSRDGGVRWTRIWEGRSVYFGPIAITPEGRFLGESIEDLRIDRPDGSQEHIRFRYSPEYRCGERVHAMQFITRQQGTVLTCFEVYITRDAGHHWEPVPLNL
jgi:photosystem II stability/assembly factor-like uncharacterized protein